MLSMRHLLGLSGDVLDCGFRFWQFCVDLNLATPGCSQSKFVASLPTERVDWISRNWKFEIRNFANFLLPKVKFEFQFRMGVFRTELRHKSAPRSIAKHMCGQWKSKNWFSNLEIHLNFRPFSLFFISNSDQIARRWNFYCNHRLNWKLLFLLSSANCFVWCRAPVVLTIVFCRPSR